MPEKKSKICIMSHSCKGKDYSYGYGAARVTTTAWKSFKNAEFNIFDLKTGYGEDNDFAYIEKVNPDILGLSVFLWNLKRVGRIISEVRISLPETVIVLGGPSAKGYEEVSREPLLPDFIICGEGEVSFLELMRRLEEGTLKLGEAFDRHPLDRRKGLFVPEKLEYFTENLDSLGSPYLENVFSPPGDAVYIETSRGCPNMCAFCVCGRKNNRLRYFDMKTIRKELCWAGRKGCRKIEICDAALNYNTPRLEEFVRIALEADIEYNLSFGFALHADYLDNEQIRLLSQLKIDCATMGLNSITPETFGPTRRKIDSGKFRDKAGLLRNLPNPNITIMLGLPGDTPEGFKKTLDYCSSLDIHVNCFELKVFPGTYLYDNAAAFDLKYDIDNDMNVLSSFSFSENDLDRMREMLNSYINSGSRFCNGDEEFKN